MPVDFSIKQVPDAVADRLRARAERNHRSLQGELRFILEEAAKEPSSPGARALYARASARGHVSTGSIVDLIREMREERTDHLVTLVEPSRRTKSRK